MSFEVNATVVSTGMLNDYVEQVNTRVENLMSKHTDTIQGEARGILSNNQYVWTGKLERGITTSVKRYVKRITGKVHTGKTHYAMALHEGTKNVGGKLERYFVPFSVSPSLKRWARSKGFDVDSMDGLEVSHPALKYMEIPFENNLNSFLREMGNAVK